MFRAKKERAGTLYKHSTALSGLPPGNNYGVVLSESRKLWIDGITVVAMYSAAGIAIPANTNRLTKNVKDPSLRWACGRYWFISTPC